MFTRLYLHVPFCLSKCGYCAFNSQELQESDLDRYMDLLLEEMRLTSAAITPARRVDSIYFGGGTPSLLEAGQIRCLIEKAAELFGVDTGVEITLEANPGTIDETRLAAFHRAGINRLSLGVQSLDDKVLQCLGRLHSAGQARAAFRHAREAGFDNIGIDLMNSLPLQTLSEWQTDLRNAILLSPEHFSIYGLTIEEGTRFACRYPLDSPERGDDDISADMFEMADDILTEAGYEHYEIANYARPGYRSRHNTGYWQRDGYLGLGVGAHSLLRGGENDIRFSNVGNLEEYSVAVAAGRLPRLEMQCLSREEAMQEYIFLGLRVADGVSLEKFEAEFGSSCRSIYGEVIDGLVRLDLLLCNETDLRLTRRGMLLSNQVFARFIF